MLQVGDTLRFSKKAVLCLLVELVNAQHLERQYTTERRRFTYLVDMAIRSCANERNNFVDADVRSLYQVIASLTVCRACGIVVPPAWIQTTNQLTIRLLYIVWAAIMIFNKQGRQYLLTIVGPK